MLSPKIFIIILNWQRFEDTVACCDSLLKYNTPNTHLLVVNNSLSKVEAQKLYRRFSKIKVLNVKRNLGFAEGNNLGIQYALKKKTDYILLLNNDTVVTNNFLSGLIDYAKTDKRVGIIGPKILYYHSDKIWFNGVKLYPLLGLFRHQEINKDNHVSYRQNPFPTDYVCGAAMLIKHQVLEDIGFFNPSYFAYFEEADFCYRARKKGYQSVIVPRSIIFHKVIAKNLVWYSRIRRDQACLYARNSLIFGIRNLIGLDKFLFILAQYTVALIYNIFRCENFSARKNYLIGLKEITFHLNQYTAYEKEKK